MRPLLFVLSFFYLSFASGQNLDQKIDPPGTIQLNEKLFIDEVPVTNSMFLEYLDVKDFLKSKGYDSWKTFYTEEQQTEMKIFALAYPSFLKNLEGEESLLSRRGYFEDHVYSKTPVLRITKAQAEDFCQWRTEMVEYAWKYFPRYAAKKDFAGKIQYRLPSAEEMETARKHFSEKEKLVTISKKNPLRYKPSSDSLKFILYNISEFTLSNSLYGKNWKEVVPAEFPNDYTGFRCVCEVREE